MLGTSRDRNKTRIMLRLLHMPNWDVHRRVKNKILLKLKFLWNGIPVRVQELCESQGDHLGLSVLMNLTVSVEVKQHRTMLRHWQPTSEDMKLYIIIINGTMCTEAERRWMQCSILNIYARGWGVSVWGGGGGGRGRGTSKWWTWTLCKQTIK